MQDILIGVFAILVGAVFCFGGYAMMRILLPLWGLVAGFWFGAEIVHLIGGDGFLTTTISIVSGIIFALLGAALAYAYYSVAILLFMGVVGFWLGAGFITLLGFHVGVISTVVGLALATVFVLSGLFLNVPKYFLHFITAGAGAGLAVAGLLVLLNVVEPSALNYGAYNVAVSNGLFWELVWLGLAVLGLSTQLAATEAAETAQLQWAAEWETKAKKGKK